MKPNLLLKMAVAALTFTFASSAAYATAGAAVADEPVAKVFDRVITKGELNRALSSLPGGDPTTRRDPLELNKSAWPILASMIDAELLYQAAVAEGITKTPVYQAEIATFSEATLAELYLQQFYDKSVTIDKAKARKLAKENDLTFEGAMALLRRDKVKQAHTAEIARLSGKHTVLFQPVIAQKDVTALTPNDVLVTASDFSVTWGDVKTGFYRFGSTRENLLDYLSQVVEEKLLAAEGKETGFATDPRYLSRLDEFKKSRAANRHRDAVRQRLAPSQKQVNACIKANDYLHHEPRLVSALMIVVDTEAKALDLRKRILAGESFYELAMTHSIAPDAKARAGRMGAVKVGDRPYNPVDRALIGLQPGEISAPIAGAKGYAIFQLLEITPKVERPQDVQVALAKKELLDSAYGAYILSLREKGDIEIYHNASREQQ